MEIEIMMDDVAERIFLKVVVSRTIEEHKCHVTILAKEKYRSKHSNSHYLLIGTYTFQVNRTGLLIRFFKIDLRFFCFLFLHFRQFFQQRSFESTIEILDSEF